MAEIAIHQNVMGAQAQDPQIAVAAEFHAAQRSNTRAAWELFIARHPDNPLTAAARAALSKAGP